MIQYSGASRKYCYGVEALDYVQVFEISADVRVEPNLGREN
jgi:hypothetical protein